MRRLWLFAATLLAALPLALFAADPAPTKGVDLRMVDRVLSGPTKGIDVKGSLPADRVFDLRAKADAPKYLRGHKSAPADVVAKRHADAFKRHGHRMRSLPEATPATFDVDALGWGTPVRDQGQCGSCWNVSACDTITCSYVKAGQAKGDGSFEISPQYVMDCENTGGCNGDDAPHVFEIAKSKGIPSERDYGPYVARSNSCKFKQGTTRYAIKDFIFATSGQQYGFATTQEVKNAIVAYGMVSTAIAANGDWDNLGSDGALRYRKMGENDIDHDVNITGWDDNRQIPGAPTKGAFRVKNQWSKQYGDGGYLWVAYGSHAIGYEACAVYVNTPLPPPTPDPTPVPPTPVPPTPVPPGPNPPVPGKFTGTIAKVTTYKDGVQVGPEVTVVGTGGQTDLEAEFNRDGINPLLVMADLAQLYADVKAKAGMAVLLKDFAKLIADLTPAADREKAGGCCGEPVAKADDCAAAPPVTRNDYLESVLLSLGVPPLLVADVLQLDADSRAGASPLVLLTDVFKLVVDQMFLTGQVGRREDSPEWALSA